MTGLHRHWRGRRPSLARLRQRAQLSSPARIEILSKRRPVTLMVFDVLYLRYKNVMAQPLVDRRGRVQELIERLGNPHLLAPSYVLEHGRHYFAEIERHGLEGVMAKRLDSPYSPGRRLPDWLKIKVATYLRGSGHALLEGLHEIENLPRFLLLRGTARIRRGFRRESR